MVYARKGSFGDMYGDGWYEVARDRAEGRRREAAEARLAHRLAGDRDPLRARIRARAARLLFALAVAVERRETWRVVWERLGERGRL